MVRSQIDTLTINPSFGHNLCCKYSNGLWEFILDIYISRAFQWYNFFFNPISFDPSKFSLKIQDFIKTSIPKMRAHLGMCGFIPSHYFAFPKMRM